jgi:ankyrin repeat protein
MEKYFLHKKTLESNLEGVQEAISQGADLNELDNLGHTALHWAVFGGYYNIVKKLLEAGANPNVISEDGVSPKWRAQDFGLKQIEELLTSYGGKVLTNHSFNKKAFSAFNNLIGMHLPKKEK